MLEGQCYRKRVYDSSDGGSMRRLASHLLWPTLARLPWKEEDRMAAYCARSNVYQQA